MGAFSVGTYSGSRPCYIVGDSLCHCSVFSSDLSAAGVTRLSQRSFDVLLLSHIIMPYFSSIEASHHSIIDQLTKLVVFRQYKEVVI